jgi:hypothetical protein
MSSLGSNLRWEERVERASTEMEVLHEAEQPCPRVSTSLSEAFHGAHWLARVTDTIALHTGMCELALLWCQPGGRERRIREEEKAKDGDESGDCALTTTLVSDCAESEDLTTNRMNSHRQPAMPRSPSMPAKTPAAIKPEKPVARICAQYSNAMRVATSGVYGQLKFEFLK